MIGTASDLNLQTTLAASNDQSVAILLIELLREREDPDAVLG